VHPSVSQAHPRYVERAASNGLVRRRGRIRDGATTNEQVPDALVPVRADTVSVPLPRDVFAFCATDEELGDQAASAICGEEARARMRTEEQSNSA
jgi:hypothetical protein